MIKRPLVILWLLGILALCLPLSYLINVKQNTYYNEKDFMLLVLVCAVVAFLMLGAISWGTYYFMKKREMAHAGRNGLLIFTGLAVGVSLVSAPEGFKKMKQRRMYLDRDAYRADFMKGCVESGKSTLMPMMEGEIENPESKIESYCSCMYDKMDADAEISELMRDETVSNEEFHGNAKVKQIRAECQGEFFK